MNSLQALPWGLGVIEGFYGRPWREQDRVDTLAFLGRAGYRYYVYAPKSDTVLRRNWRDRWDAAAERHLSDLGKAAASEGVVWGVGLSPLGLVEDLGPAALRELRAKLSLIDGIGVELLCVLFDDMPRSVQDLAARQAEVIAEVAAATKARHLIVCPSYYSRDPVLERLFGARPERYWEDLGAALPAQAGIFWTGERVCSQGYVVRELRDIAGILGRPPVLWDNYPVNDGARMADFLHLDAFSNRPPDIATVCAAHFVNPMNQCRLSRIPLATLPRVYSEGGRYAPERAFDEAAREFAGEPGAALLAADRPVLQHQGLKALDAEQRARLVDRYAALDTPWARELIDWLRGGYAFDPACLTD
jgi:hypothetical protein